MTVTITPYIKVTTPTEIITQNVKSCGRASCEPRIISHGDNFCGLCGSRIIEKTIEKVVKVSASKLLTDNNIELNPNVIEFKESIGEDGVYFIPKSTKSVWTDLNPASNKVWILDVPSSYTINNSVNALKKDHAELINALEKAFGKDKVILGLGIINY